MLPCSPLPVHIDPGISVAIISLAGEGLYSTTLYAHEITHLATDGYDEIAFASRIATAFKFPRVGFYKLTTDSTDSQVWLWMTDV
jgi:hypothetical protein